MNTSKYQYRSDVVASLMHVRHELETVARGDSLTELQVYAGLLLHNLANALQLSDRERQVAFGIDLMNEIEYFLNQPALDGNE